MRTNMLLAAAAVAVSLGGCTSTSYTENPEEIRLRVGMGGFVKPILERYADWDRSGKLIVIDGHMVSADAFGAFSSKNACYTENAIFSPHAASQLGLVPDYALTERLTAMLPEALATWFRGNLAYRDWVGFAMVEYPDLLQIWPEGACEEDHDAALARWRQRRDAELAEAALADMR